MTRKAQAEASRQRLLDAAAALFAERPYDEVNVADIARAAGLAHGLLFHHFGSKRGVYLAALEAIAAGHRRGRESGFAPGGVGLRAILRAHFESIANNPTPFLRLMTAGVGADPEAHAIFERDRWDAIGELGRRLDLDIDQPAARIALRGAVGGIDHTVLTWFDLGQPNPLDDVVDTMISILRGAVHGIAALDPELPIDAALATLADAASREESTP